MVNLVPLLGLGVIILTAYLLCENKQKINWRTLLSALLLQFLMALFILKTEVGKEFFNSIGLVFNSLLSYTQKGSEFIFGNLAKPNDSWGFIFFTMVLPTIIFISSLMSVLYHIGLMQRIVQAVAYVMMKFMGTSGAESIASGANIFMGQTEAPLVIKPYIEKMTASEIMSLMTGGMATVAGGVLVAYVGFGIDAGHLLAASVMSAPAALGLAKLMVPETEIPETNDKCSLKSEKLASNVVDAAAIGASDGLKLAANVGAMLLAFISLIALLNGLLGWSMSLIGLENITFELILGYLNAPVAWLMGVPWSECQIVGSILGKRLILNEFVGYIDLIAAKENLSPKTFAITTYALCGFANFSSIAIQIGGIGSMSPNKRKTIVKYGFKSLIAGTLACYMTACIAALLI